MIKHTYFCDCCKRSVAKGKLNTGVVVYINCDSNKPWQLYDFQHKDGRKDMDLCDTCYKNFLEYIDTFLLKEAE